MCVGACSREVLRVEASKPRLVTATDHPWSLHGLRISYQVSLLDNNPNQTCPHHGTQAQYENRPPPGP